jgi:hypothetical protein
LPFIDGEPSRVEQYAPPGHCPLAPPLLLSALLFGCGEWTSPEVPDVPEVWCELAEPWLLEDVEVEADLCDVVEVDLCVEVEVDLCDDEPDPCDDEPVDFCEDALEEWPLPLPGVAKAEPPPTPSEIKMRASAAVIAPSGRARSRTARNIECHPTPDPEKEAGK